MRMDRSLRSPRAWHWPVAVAVIAAMLTRRRRTHRPEPAWVSNYSGLTASQQATLLSMARDTWKFYSLDVDPGTHLPLDNVSFTGGSAAPTTTAGTRRLPTSGCTCGR